MSATKILSGVIGAAIGAFLVDVLYLSTSRKGEEKKQNEYTEEELEKLDTTYVILNGTIFDVSSKFEKRQQNSFPHLSIGRVQDRWKI